MKKTLITVVSISVFYFSTISNCYSSKPCAHCHRNIVVEGVHSGIVCQGCHKKTNKHYEKNATTFKGNMCIRCHKDVSGIMSNVMTTRSKEINIIEKAFNSVDKDFYDKNCKSSCHVNKCMDCHTFDSSTHIILKPNTDKCLKCHNGYFTGIDFIGLAIREDHNRYKRGIRRDSDYYLKMLPDVHYEKGFTCNECHSMKSLSKNKTHSKGCTDCHKKIDTTIVEHNVAQHIKKLECYACHSAWSVNELGTFFVQFIGSDIKKFYKDLPNISSEYVKSAFLKEYGPPYLCINSNGKYTPVRAEFIFFFTQIYKNKLIGDDNRLIGAYWKAFLPHTIRSETVMCEQCHENRKKYLLIDKFNDYYELSKDDIMFESFYSGRDQSVINGHFIDNETYNNKINKKTINYVESYLKKWREFIHFIESVEE